MVFGIPTVVGVFLHVLFPLYIFPVGVFRFLVALSLMGLGLIIFTWSRNDKSTDTSQRDVLKIGRYFSLFILYIGLGVSFNTWWMLFFFPPLIPVFYYMVLGRNEHLNG